jgi:hypothetical protein
MKLNDPRQSAVRKAEAIYGMLGADPGSMLASLLDLHAERTGRNAARHAARVLRGAVKNGRRGIDDTASLRRIAKFPPSQRHQAVGIVAKFMAGGETASKRKVASIGKRLRR